jgi:hypothetical protein
MTGTKREQTQTESVQITESGFVPYWIWWCIRANTARAKAAGAACAQMARNPFIIVTKG